MAGKQVLAGNAANEFNIDLSGLAKGVYFVKIGQNSQIFFKD
jgi:hypothetical protein